MLVFSSYKALAERDSQAEQTGAVRPRAVVIGNFDGVHLGHQQLFKVAQKLSPSVSVMALTFWPHPARFFAAKLAPPLIMSRRRRRERLSECGVELLIEQPFDAAFASLSPEAFVNDVLVDGLGARHVVVGHDFTFGKGRAGNTEVLRKLLARRGAEACIVPAFTIENPESPSSPRIICSSTYVRREVAAGHPERAALCLGREVELEGVVVHGAARGRTIGFPTANLDCEADLRPAVGIYAAWADVLEFSDDKEDAGAEPTCHTLVPRAIHERYPAAVSVGYNATFTAGDPLVSVLSIEAHLILPAEAEPLAPLYKKTVRLHLVRRLRDELRFPSVESLVAQITRDVEETKALLQVAS